MNTDLSYIIQQVPHIPPVHNGKRSIIFLLLFLLLFLVIMRTFDHTILIWASIVAYITYLADSEFSLGKHLVSSEHLRKVLVLLISITVLFSLIDVYWKSVEWIKVYIDSGTVLFILFLIVIHVFPISQRVYTSTVLFALAVIPALVIAELPILAETYAVFAFLLLSRYLLREVRAVRTIT